jgi:hypothetical protein
MIYDGTVHLAMNGMRSVGSVSGDVTTVKCLPYFQELSHSSPATFLHANLMVALDSQLRRGFPISTSIAIWRIGRV